MKAESIEQIREHLERGGRVTFSNDDFNEEWEVVKIGVGALFATCNGEIVEIPIYRFNSRDWELLPIEEESLCDKCKYQSDSTQFCHKCKQVWLRLRGEAESEPKPIEKETGICSACPTCGREDDDFDAFEAFEESQGKAWCDKLSEMRQEQEQREMYERIRNALLFGRKPEMADLLAWWQATTGERIEHGERCARCGGDGNQSLATTLIRGVENPVMSQLCKKCGGSGYRVKPTWMEEQTQ